MWKAEELLKSRHKTVLLIAGSGQKVRFLLGSIAPGLFSEILILDDDLQGGLLLEYFRILSFEQYFARREKEQDFIIVTDEKPERERMLVQHGLEKGTDFIFLSEYLLYGLPERKSREVCPLPEFNQIDVKITYDCNFRCEYCYQADGNGNHSKKFLSREHAEHFITFVKRLGEAYYITLAGGEPFVYPHLQYLVEKLTALGNYVSLITNFSAPYEKIEKIILAAREKLATFNISVHLSQWKNMEVFYEKLEKVLLLIQKEQIPLKIRTTCVLTEENFERLVRTDRVMKERFPGVSFDIQRVYHDNVYEVYSDQIENFLKQRGLDVPVEEANHIDFYGRKCWAGTKFFYIEVNGVVKRCYTNQFNRSVYELGTLSDAEHIRVLDGPAPCLSVHCGSCVCYRNFVDFRHITEQTASAEEVRGLLEL